MIRLLAAAAAAFLFASPSIASIARSVSFDEKVGASDAIVLGRVVASESRWDAERRWILTYSTFEVERALKGTPAPRLTLVTPGGTADGIRQETIGSPVLNPGDERVIFVRGTSAGPTVAFLDQGVYAVERDARGRKIVRAAAPSVVTIDAVTGKAATAEPSGALSIDEFETRVQASIRRDGAPARMAAARPAEKAGWRDELTAFARDQWKVLLLAGVGILLALIPLLLRLRSS